MMRPSPECFALIRASEGCRLQSYPDSGGVWTIGYGHTRGVVQGMTCTQAQAEGWMVMDADAAATAVLKLVQVPLNQGQLDALTDFVFNLGSGALRHSELLTYINQGNMAAAAGEFGRWVHDAGVVLPGLVVRREAERKLFLGIG